jgi:Glycosyltransferase family 87
LWKFFFSKLFVLPAQLASVSILILLLARARVPRRIAYAVLVFGLGCFFIRLIVLLGSESLLYHDFEVYWTAGRAFWAGQDPYTTQNRPLFPLNYPPNDLPLFALLALLPIWKSFCIWTALNAGLCLGLVPLSCRLLQGEREPAPGGAGRYLEPDVEGVLSVVVLLSIAAWMTIDVGQASLIVAASLLLALLAQQRGRPIIAGIGLAVAAIKPSIMVPFLLLFHRKADIPAWITLILATGLVSLTTSAPLEFKDRCITMLDLAVKHEAAGQINDYSSLSKASESIIGPAHALWRLGIENRQAIRVLQGGLVLGTGSLLAWLTIGSRLPREAAISFVALYSMMFLYHRWYDMVILVVPLTFATHRTLSARGSLRTLYFSAVVLMVVALNPSSRFYEFVQDQSWKLSYTIGALVRAIILPWVTWLILVATALLGIAVRQEIRADEY